MTGLERDAGEDDRGREHAEDAGREDEHLLEPAPVGLERRSDVGQERQDARLGGRDVGDGRRQPGHERCERGRGECGTGARIGESRVEEHRRWRVDGECVPGGECEVDKPADLQACVAEPSRESRQQDRLRRPRERQRVVREEVRGRDGDQGEGRGADEERE